IFKSINMECFQRLTDVATVQDNQSTKSSLSTINGSDLTALGLGLKMNVPGYIYNNYLEKENKEKKTENRKRKKNKSSKVGDPEVRRAVKSMKKSLKNAEVPLNEKKSKFKRLIFHNSDSEDEETEETVDFNSTNVKINIATPKRYIPNFSKTHKTTSATHKAPSSTTSNLSKPTQSESDHDTESDSESEPDVPMIEEEQPKGLGQFASWSKSITLVFINEYEKNYENFHTGRYRKKEVWEMIHQGIKRTIKSGNPVPSATQCKTKWRT
uniref:Uncharacterized protein n=1 Tax=Clytia hemisphaerica TaxID=252671 RepID=A0A7M5WZZ8_9CNID